MNRRPSRSALRHVGPHVSAPGIGPRIRAAPAVNCRWLVNCNHRLDLPLGLVESALLNWSVEDHAPSGSSGLASRISGSGSAAVSSRCPPPLLPPSPPPL